MIQTRGREGGSVERHDEGWEAHLWPPTKSLFVKKKSALSRLGHTCDTYPQVSCQFWSQCCYSVLSSEHRHCQFLECIWLLEKCMFLKKLPATDFSCSDVMEPCRFYTHVTVTPGQCSSGGQPERWAVVPKEVRTPLPFL